MGGREGREEKINTEDKKTKRVLRTSLKQACWSGGASPHT